MYYSEQQEFISIVIPAYNRFDYLENLVNSIHKYADMPFELIVSDDGSNNGTTSQIISRLKDKTSSIILNNGLSLGIAHNINRAVEIANSNFILMLNADFEIRRPFFRELIDILKVPFVGLVMPIMDKAYKSGPNRFVTKNGTKFYISKCLGSGGCLTFRKDVYQEIGKFDNFGCDSCNADVSFMIRVLKNGYFWANFEANRQAEDIDKCTNSTVGSQIHDCSFPRLFGISDDANLILSKKHWDVCRSKMQITYRELAGNTNIDYWNSYLAMLINDDQGIDFIAAKTHGQDRWKEDIRIMLKDTLLQSRKL